MSLSKFKRLAALALTAPIMFAGCAAAQSQVEAAPPAVQAVTEPAPAVRQAKPALWVVKDDDTTIYLFGTIHLLPKDVVWFQQPVKDALANSDALVLEIIEPTVPETFQLFNKYSNAGDGINLRDRMDASARAKYEAQMQSLGLPVAMFDKKLPWFAQLNIYLLTLMKAGWDPNSGAERAITTAAKDAGKPILALETADAQFAMLSSASMENQMVMLNETVADPAAITSTMDELIIHWIAGDEQAMGDAVDKSFSQSAEIEAELLTKRNANWTIWLDKRMDEPGTIFVAVGAAHLAGRNSVQSMLANEGHVAQRVVY